jgi:hypothetical protein
MHNALTWNGVRRVCWAYMRQLWDEEYSAWAAQDEANEEFHSSVWFVFPFLYARDLLSANIVLENA